MDIDVGESWKRDETMKNQNIFISLGIVIYIVISGIDKFVYRLPNMVYIPIAILGIILILIGFLKIKKDNHWQMWVRRCYLKIINYEDCPRSFNEMIKMGRIKCVGIKKFWIL